MRPDTVGRTQGGTVRVAELWRYPVKSMQGERLDFAVVEADGLAGDRCWALRDDATGKILTARREPRLLHATGRLAADGEPVVALPDGTTVIGAGPVTDVVLSEWIGRPVSLVKADGGSATAEAFTDPTDDASEMQEWSLPAGRFVDAMPVHVLTTASLRTAAGHYVGDGWPVRRFRPNVLVDTAGHGWLEDAWVDEVVQIGAVGLKGSKACNRCTMVTRPQEGIAEDRDVFRTLAREHAGRFGLLCEVVAAGRIVVGDAVAVIPRQQRAAPVVATGSAPAR